jgi:cytochrome P450
MISLSAGAVLVLLATFLYIVLPLARNIRIANASRIPYVIVPYYTYNRLTARFMARTWMRLVDKFAPSLSTTAWRQLVTPQWVWKLRYAPFKRLNTDTFLTVAPGGIILNTADANVITQIFARPDDFPKATHLYSPVEIFGKNVVSTTGEVWRHHRAATGPAFTEKNNQLVWEETLGITRALLDSWTGNGPEGGNKTIDSVAGDTMRLSLEVIGRAGLGQKSGWPNATEALPTGHTMSFTAAVQYLLANMVPVVLFPKWFLSKSMGGKLGIRIFRGI